jgi:hypothetical protein
MRRLLALAAALASIAVLSVDATTYAAVPGATRAMGPARGASTLAPSNVRADFNGDGYADLAVTAREYDVNGAADAGGTNVIYGGPSGLQTSSPSAQFWTENSPGVPGRATTDDWFGRGLGAGDFNGDGYTDLAMGAPHKDIRGVKNAGSVTVVYGSASGLQGTGPRPQWLSQYGNKMPGDPDINGQFGDFMDSGDFNADGYADLAIGVRDQVVNGHQGAGSVIVMFGSPTGLRLTSPPPQYWTQDNIGSGEQSGTGNEFGRFVWTADFNGDGYSDLTVGAPFEMVDGIPSAGQVDVLFGGPSGLQTTSPPTQVWNQNSPGMAGDGAENDDEFGYFVGGSDLNGDGYGDLAIGLRYEDVGTVMDSGAVNVLYGGPGGLSTVGSEWWTEESPGVMGVSETAEGFGRAWAPCDFNGDGYGDLGIAVPSQDDVGTAAGAIHVLYGSATGLQADNPDDQVWNQNSPGVPGDGEQSGDNFGYIETGDDFNGDGYCDLSGSALYDSVGAVKGAGQTRTIYGSLGGLQTVDPPAQEWDQSTPGLGSTAQEHALFGAGTT